MENDRGPLERRLAIIEYEKPRKCKIIPEFAEELIREDAASEEACQTRHQGARQEIIIRVSFRWPKRENPMARLTAAGLSTP
jgi:hypothetical protein